MILPSSLSRTRLALLVFLSCSPAIHARVAIDPLSPQQFTTSFRTYLGTTPGGCSRSAPNGASMMSHVLESLGGANAIAQTVVQDLPTYATQTYVRGLLFLFFGITFLADHTINPDPGQDNQNAYNDILKNFDAARQVFVSPNPAYPKPRYRCLEDFATYYEHDVGTDHRENTSAPLIAEVLNVRTSAGEYFPGLMYVYNSLDGSAAWYPGQESKPAGGTCGQLSLGSNRFVLEFTNAAVGMDPAIMNALYGITACPTKFNLDTILDLGTPAANGGMDEIDKFIDASDLTDLHEIIHLVTLAGITGYPQTIYEVSQRYADQTLRVAIGDIAAIEPPNNDWTSRAWAQWSLTSVAGVRSYGFLRTAYLGLARPGYARFNADNYRVFAGCMYFTELECLGTFQSYIQTKRDLPFQTSLSHKAIEKIRAGKFDLTKDLPMDADLQQEPDGRSLAEDDDLDDKSFEAPLGDAERHNGRFKDVINGPAAMFG